MKEADFLSKLKRLEEAEDHGERNALAIELSDTKDGRVFGVLVNLVQKPELENYRGTLIYSLENYDCSPITDLLIGFAEAGNYEVRMQAEIILDGQSLR